MNGILCRDGYRKHSVGDIKQTWWQEEPLIVNRDQFWDGEGHYRYTKRNQFLAKVKAVSTG
jgi:hypothetical protein